MDSYATRSHACVAHQTPKVRTTTAHRAQGTQLGEVFAVLVLAIEAALIWLVDTAVLEPGAHIFVEAIHSRGILGHSFGPCNLVHQLVCLWKRGAIACCWSVEVLPG